MESKAVLIPREVAALTPLVSQDDPRYALRCIRIEPNGDDKIRAVVTDGYKLAFVDYPRVGTEEFPRVAGFEPNGFEAVNVPPTLLNAACKAAPKRNKTLLPVLFNVGLTTHGPDLTFAATDLDTPSVVSGKAAEGAFPRYQEVIPGDSEGIEVTLNAESLCQIVKALMQATGGADPAITLRVYPVKTSEDKGRTLTNQKPVKLTREGALGTAVGVLMPREK